MILYFITIFAVKTFAFIALCHDAFYHDDNGDLFIEVIYVWNYRHCSS